MNSQVMWYYQSVNGREGPLPEMEIENLIRDGVIVWDTLVWKSGMEDWCEAGLSDLNDKYELKMQGDGIVQGDNRDSDSYLTSRKGLAKKLRLWYLIFGVSLCISAFLSSFAGLVLVMSVISLFFGLLIMYHVWKSIPESKRMFSPFVTVILMIVPVLNLFWIFYCYYSGAKKLNQTLKEKGVEDFKVDEFLALGYPIAVIFMTVIFVISVATTTVFPLLNQVMVIFMIFIQLFLMKSYIIGIMKLE